jgi:hypothetical protein
MKLVTPPGLPAPVGSSRADRLGPSLRAHPWTAGGSHLLLCERHQPVDDGAPEAGQAEGRHARVRGDGGAVAPAKGDDIVGRLAQDLAADTRSPRGFSRRNPFYMRRFATMWPEREKVQPLGELRFQS